MYTVKRHLSCASVAQWLWCTSINIHNDTVSEVAIIVDAIELFVSLSYSATLSPTHFSDYCGMLIIADVASFST